MTILAADVSPETVNAPISKSKTGRYGFRGMGNSLFRHKRIEDKNNNKGMFKASLLIKELGNEAKILRDDSKNFNIYTAFIILCKNKGELARKLLIRGIDTDMEMMQNCGRIFSNETFKGADLIETKSLRVPLSFQFSDREVRYTASIVGRYAK